MTFGIWCKNTSPENMLRLYNFGIRGTSIGLTSGGTWDDAVQRMWNFYKSCKAIGYTHFLLQMRSESTKYQDKVIAKFKDCSDVEYLCGEPYELVEKSFETVDENGNKVIKKWSEKQLRHSLYLLDRKIVVETKDCKDLIVDIQLRLWNKIDKFFPKVPSSYFWQQRKWYKEMPFAWIYGQLTWHSFIPFMGSLCYKRLKKRMDELGITVAYLYQEDGGKFTNLLNDFLLKRFINKMGEK